MNRILVIIGIGVYINPFVNVEEDSRRITLWYVSTILIVVGIAFDIIIFVNVEEECRYLTLWPSLSL